MAKLFFLLSGEHETLPVAELKAILEAENHPFGITEKLDQTLRLEAELNCVEAIKRRAAFTRLCGMELFTCKAETAEIVKAANAINPNEFLKNGESFAVRVKHIKNHCAHVDSMVVERKLGEIILNKKANAKVNLKNPEKTFFGILTDEKFVFGVKIAEFPPTQFVERRPKKKPFFHPSAMPAKLARCMVNLAKPKTGELVFDPFCGTGSILIEAALIGCHILGLDIQKRMIKGANKNMKHFNINPEGIIVADAAKPPITKVDCVVADPPYGRSASTMKRTTKQIVEECLEAVREMLNSGKRVCIAAPKTLNITSLAAKIGYRHLESNFVYVHRSLTREIAVFEKA
ncbi:MAG: THUMP domain-containing protein [Candidatus Bathyarchaeia archaeon]